MLTGLCCLISCAAPQIDDAPGLAALRGPLVDVSREVLRVDDDALTMATRDLVSTYNAALGVP